MDMEVRTVKIRVSRLIVEDLHTFFFLHDDHPLTSNPLVPYLGYKLNHHNM